MLNRFYLFFSENPFRIIWENKPKTLYDQLKRGLDPNTKNDRDYTLLATALVHHRPLITTMLLQQGANLNERLHMGGYHFAIDIAFEDPHYGRSLLRLLLTYGATYDHLWEHAREYGWEKTEKRYHSGRYPDLIWMDSVKEICYRIDNLQKDGKRLFSARQFGLAKAKFEEAVLLLPAFAEQEKQFQTDDDSKRKAEKRIIYKSDEAYVEDYLARAAQCQDVVLKCEQQENPESSETDALLETKKTV